MASIPTTVNIPDKIHDRLSKEAGSRDLGIKAFIDLLLQHICEDDLFEAILDGADGLPNSIGG